MSSSDRRQKPTEKAKEINRKVSSKDKVPKKETKTEKEKEKREDKVPKMDKKKEKPREEEEKKKREKERKKKQNEEEKRSKKGAEKEAKKEKKEKEEKKEEEEQQQHYEDDFEQYESDFDEDMEEAGSEENVGQKSDRNEEEKAKKGKDEEEDAAKSSLLLQRVAEGGKMRTNKIREQHMTEVRREVNFDGPQLTAVKWQRGAENDGSPELFEPTHSSMLINSENEAKSGERAAHLMDFYMELAGKREGKAQAYTQMPEHRLTIGTQTERGEAETKETQRGIGDGTNEKSAEMDDQQKQKKHWEKGRKMGDGTRRLNIILKAVEHLVNGVLSLSLSSASDHRPLLQHNSNLSFSSRFSTISMSNAFFKEGRLCAMAVKDPHTIAAVIFVPKSDDVRLHRKSFVAEFSVESPEIQSQRVLRCEQEVVVLRYAPDSFSAAFAGLKDGSVVTWDLLAEEESPLQMVIENGVKSNSTAVSTKFRDRLSVLLPCFDTAFYSLKAKNDEENGPGGSNSNRSATSAKQKRLPRHFHSAATNCGANGAEMPSTIVAMEMFDSEAKVSGVLAQLVTLYESGTVRWWTALDNQQRASSVVADDFDDQQNDVQHEQNIRMVPLFAAKCFGGRLNAIGDFATCMAIGTKGRVLVGTSGGQIVSIGRGGAANECLHYNNNNGIGFGAEEIISIRSCPLQNGIFAVITSQRLLFFDQSVRVPLFVHSLPPNALFGPTLFEWCPSDHASSPFFTIHGGELITLWKYKSGTKHLQSEECDLKGEIKAKVRATLAWTDQRGNAFVALLLSNDQIQVHCMEKSHSSDNSTGQFFETISAKNAI